MEASFPPSERKESKEMTGQQLRFYVVDVFAEAPLCGNPLALVVNATALITFRERLDFVATSNYNYDQGIKINRSIGNQEKP